MDFNNLPPVNKRIVVGFAVSVILALCYFLFIKIPYGGPVKTPDVVKGLPVDSGSPYFIPPTSTVKEVQVTGKIVAATDELKDATHKIVDGGGAVIIYAKTNDDKLRQQEGNVITLVGNISLTEEIGPTTVMEVSYISFK